MVTDTRILLDHLATECAARAWRLAAAMLRDPHAAYDAVQQAFLVAARKPHRVPREAPWPWFAAVVVGEVRNMRRKRRPRTNLTDVEGRSGAAPGRSTDPVLRAEQRELGEALDRALGALTPEEREAVLLTQMAGMTHAEAANTMGLSRPTVTRRVQDGLRRMASDVGRSPQALGGGFAFLPIGAPPGGLELAAQTWIEGAMATIASAATGSAAGAAATGVGAMGSKWMVAAGITAALGLGFAGGTVFEQSRSETTATEVASETPGALRAETTPSSESANEAGLRGTAAETLVELRDENAALSTRLTEAQGRVQELEAALAAQGGKGDTQGPTFSFGRAGQLEGVQKARWGELATASQIVIANIKKVLDAQEAGEQPAKEVYLAIQEHVEQMRRYEYRTIGKLATNAKHNGEFTHPITLTNLLAERLAQAGMSLSETQVAKINALGQAYEKDFDANQARFGDGDPRAERMLAEYKLKGAFQRDLLAVFTAEQRAQLFDPEVQGIASLDLYDPTLMIIHTSPILTGDTPEAIRGKLATVLGKKFSLDEAALARLEPHLS